MRRFLLRTSLAALLFALLAVGMDAILGWCSYGKQFERYADLNVIRAGDSSADLVVIGNSRARYHYDSRVISQQLGRCCYNLGMIGYPVLDQLGKLQYHLKHNAMPRTVIVNLDPDSWYTLSRDTIIQYEQFLDDIRDPVILGMVRGKQGFRPSDPLPWARFAGYPGYVWKMITCDTVTNCHAGFVADTTVMPEAAFAKVLPPYQHDKRKFTAYLEAVRDHRDTYWPESRIVFVESPWFERQEPVILPHLLPLLDKERETALELDLSWAGDTSLFMNRTHLNAAGAARFSMLLCDSMRAAGL